MVKRKDVFVSSLDPDAAFEYRLGRFHQVARQSGELVPILVSRLMPASVMRSISLLIDPLYKWRVGADLVAPVSRTRWFKRASVLDIRTRSNPGVSGTTTYHYDLDGKLGIIEVKIPFGGPVQITPQEAVYTYIKDTTGRLRSPSQPFGEKKVFRVTYASPPRSWTKSTNTAQYGTVGLTPDKVIGYTKQTKTWGPSAAIFTRSAYLELERSADSWLATELQNNGLKCLNGCLPSSRSYTFGRSLLELKDLPRSIVSLRRTFEELLQFRSTIPPDLARRIFESSTQKAVPREYVGYHFGWKQMVQDVVKLFDAPERLTKRLNYLKRKAGKVSIVRNSMSYALPALSTPGWQYDLDSDELNRVIETVHLRTVKMRAVASIYFDFPDIAVPSVRDSLKRDLAGLSLRPDDLYRIIPWTWFYDWFTGLGDYIAAIDLVNRDKSLINYGLVTCDIIGEVRTVYNYRVLTQQSTVGFDGQGSTTTSNYSSFSHTSVLEYRMSSRVGADSLPLRDFRFASALKNLTSTQQAILIALLAMRTRNA